MRIDDKRYEDVLEAMYKQSYEQVVEAFHEMSRFGYLPFPPYDIKGVSSSYLPSYSPDDEAVKSDPETRKAAARAYALRFIDKFERWDGRTDLHKAAVFLHEAFEHMTEPCFARDYDLIKQLLNAATG